MQFSENSVVTDNFADVYNDIAHHIEFQGERVSSRVGDTFEVLDFKTIIRNPTKRCIGGLGRDMNVFFLLAEALWIWVGRNDVEFLEIFNSKMPQFSDNGKTFNAPYGFRLRHYGKNSNHCFVVEQKDDELVQRDDNESSSFKMDQIRWVLNLLHTDPDTRRAVISIWNPEFDTVTDSKDIPCNDLLMFKLREGRLNLTIANRSNDLHWGLCTNVFQFSFLLEIMSEILGVQVGTQTHNSQSLHIYESTMKELKMKQDDTTGDGKLYDKIYGLPGMGFQLCFNSEDINERLKQVDEWFNYIIYSLIGLKQGVNSYQTLTSEFPARFPIYLQKVLQILATFVEYKKEQKKTHEIRFWAASNLLSHFEETQNHFNNPLCADYFLLAVNWFVARMGDSSLIDMLLPKKQSKIFYNIPNSWLGKF